MAFQVDEFKIAGAFLPGATVVPGHGRPITIGPIGNAFVGTHTFSHVTEFDLRVEIGDGGGNWMPIPYAYIKSGNPANPGAVMMSKLPRGATLRAVVTRIVGDDAVMSVSIMTDD